MSVFLIKMLSFIYLKFEIKKLNKKNNPINKVS